MDELGVRGGPPFVLPCSQVILPSFFLLTRAIPLVFLCFSQSNWFLAALQVLLPSFLFFRARRPAPLLYLPSFYRVLAVAISYAVGARMSVFSRSGSFFLFCCFS